MSDWKLYRGDTLVATWSDAGARPAPWWRRVLYRLATMPSRSKHKHQWRWST